MSKTISAADPATAPPCPVSLRQRIEDLLDERIPHLFVRGNHPGSQSGESTWKTCTCQPGKVLLDVQTSPKKNMRQMGFIIPKHPRILVLTFIILYHILSNYIISYQIISISYYTILYNYIICIYCII